MQFWSNFKDLYRKFVFNIWQFASIKIGMSCSSPWTKPEPTNHTKLKIIKYIGYMVTFKGLHLKGLTWHVTINYILMVTNRRHNQLKIIKYMSRKVRLWQARVSGRDCRGCYVTEGSGLSLTVVVAMSRLSPRINVCTKYKANDLWSNKMFVQHIRQMI